MSNFYKNTIEIDKLKLSGNPQKDWPKLKKFFNKNHSLELYFYENFPNFEILTPSPEWAKILHENGQFEDLNKDSEYLQKTKSKYLCGIASQRPEDVWEIIRSLKPIDQIIQANFLDTFLKFPPEMLTDTVKTVCNYLSIHDYFVWVWLGEPAAKIMVQLAELGHINKSLKIAEIILKVTSVKKEGSVLSSNKINFDSYNYEEMLKYYTSLWKKYPFEAFALELDTLENYLNSESDSIEEDTSAYLGYKVENLDNITESISEDVVVSLVKNICDALKYIAEQPVEQIAEIIKLLDNKQKIIFERLKLFLLRQTKSNTFLPKIISILKDKKYFEHRYRFDYWFLLRDKYEFLKDDTRTFQPYLNWIDSLELEQEFKKRIAEWLRKNKPNSNIDKEIEKTKFARKAEKLFYLKDKDFFKSIYDNYLEKSGAKEKDIKPRLSMEFSEGGAIAPEENSPKSVNELRSMSVSEVLNYLKDETNYTEDKSKSEFPWHSPKEGLEGAFQKIVKEKRNEYLQTNFEELLEIPTNFLSTYFAAIRDSLSTTGVVEFEWQKIFELSEKTLKSVPKPKQLHDDSYSIRESIANIITRVMENDTKIEYSEENLKKFLEISEILIKGWDDKGKSDKEDLVQIQCNRVTSTAFENLISLGITIFKDKKLRSIYKRVYQPKYIELCDYVLKEKPIDFRLCVFGMRLPQLYYTNEKWFKDNIAELLNAKNLHSIWDTYLVWGRPYKPLFNLLKRQGIYQISIVKLRLLKGIYQIDSEEKPERNLGKHLVIAYVNNWSGSKALLSQYYNIAPVSLRCKTNNFFMTGFEKATSKEIVKIKQHWLSRIRFFKESTKSNNITKEIIHEARGLVIWIKNCPLDNKIAFDLLSKTLNYTKGRITKEDAFEIAEYIIATIFKKSKNHELQALNCLLKFSYDPRIGAYSRTWNGEFGQFVEHIKSLPADYNNRKLIWKKTLELLDNYGGMRIYQTKSHYFELLNKYKSNY